MYCERQSTSDIVYKSIKTIDKKVCAINKITSNENEINSVTKELNIISQLENNFVVEFIIVGLRKIILKLEIKVC
jgi:hypothetical protein